MPKRDRIMKLKMNETEDDDLWFLQRYYKQKGDATASRSAVLRKLIEKERSRIESLPLQP